LNAGEPIAEGEELHGSAVYAAEQIAGVAGGGQILASLVVRELVAGKGFQFIARTEQRVPGIEEPMRLYEVHWREGATA
jgi:class 3 adenylate cyclase